LDQEGSRLRKCLKLLECGTAANYSYARKTQADERENVTRGLETREGRLLLPKDGQK